ncbi:MAG: hypothetical protein ACJ75B_07835 [Flavisolibacter sp.]
MKKFKTISYSWIFIILISCNGTGASNNKTTDSSINSDKTAEEKKATSQKAQPLFKNYPDAPVTLHELSMTKAEFDHLYYDGYKKLVFHFYFLKNAPDGSPTLYVWGAKRSVKDFTTDSYQLHYEQATSVHLPENLLLGALHTDATALHDKLGVCGNGCSLYFTPVNDPHLHYEIRVVDAGQLKKSDTAAIHILAVDGYANPSPPYESNE